ncbi:MAG: hypothetical protein Q8L88_08265 [Bacteroidota bacterium]|nr:hypothetical protein [Bacteroidota bacterium]
MEDNTTHIIAGNLTTAYFTVNSAAIKGEINNSGNRQPVPPEAIWAIFQQFVTLVEHELKVKV